MPFLAPSPFFFSPCSTLSSAPRRPGRHTPAAAVPSAARRLPREESPPLLLRLLSLFLLASAPNATSPRRPLRPPPPPLRLRLRPLLRTPRTLKDMAMVTDMEEGASARAPARRKVSQRRDEIGIAPTRSRATNDLSLFFFSWTLSLSLSLSLNPLFFPFLSSTPPPSPPSLQASSRRCALSP